MRLYQRYEKGRTPIGAIVVRLYHSGGEVRGFIREIQAEENDQSIFPSEELEPEVALRLADNKRQGDPGQPIYIELAEGVEWNPDWGERHN
jgi:hypothetical protein